MTKMLPLLHNWEPLPNPPDRRDGGSPNRMYGYRSGGDIEFWNRYFQKNEAQSSKEGSGQALARGEAAAKRDTMAPSATDLGLGLGPLPRPEVETATAAALAREKFIRGYSAAEKMPKADQNRLFYSGGKAAANELLGM